MTRRDYCKICKERVTDDDPLCCKCESSYCIDCLDSSSNMFIKYHQKKQFEDATEHGIEKNKTYELIEYYNSNDCPECEKKENMDKRLHSLQSQVEQLQEKLFINGL